MRILCLLPCFGCPEAPQSSTCPCPETPSAWTETVVVPPVFPAGMVVASAGVVPPDGWLICAGQEVLKADFPELYAAIGDSFGAGSDPSFFRLPDLRGRVIAGPDAQGGMAADRLTEPGGMNGTEVGSTGGEQTVSLTSDQLPPHTHSVFVAGYPQGTSGGGSNISLPTSEAYHQYLEVTTPTGENAPVSVIQPTLVLSYFVSTGR